MTPRGELFTVLRDPGGLRFPDERDVLGQLVASDRAQALRAAERLHGPHVLVVTARAWPVRDTNDNNEAVSGSCMPSGPLAAPGVGLTGTRRNTPSRRPR